MWLRDLQWRVNGRGNDRVSTTRIDGHLVAVRPTVVDQSETWVLDVDQTRCCGQYTDRSVAMSVEAVNAAIANARARNRRPIGAGTAQR